MFFDKFREALVRLPAGLIRPGPPASPREIAAAQSALGSALPPSYVSFLESFDGAELFHETVMLGGVGPAAAPGLMDMNVPGRTKELVFAAVAGGDGYAFGPDGRVLRLRADGESDAPQGQAQDQAQERGEQGADERWRAGGDFSRWLDGLVAYHRVLYGPDGEFAPDAFEPDGAEVVPLVALRQAERALRACPDSAEWEHERGVALRRLDRVSEAKDAFAAAVALDPDNPWARFDLGRAALELGPDFAREAGAAFEAAARLDGGEAASRLWVWAARAAQLEAAPERIALCRQEALVREPALAEQLRRARDATREVGDPQEGAEAAALLDALEGPIQPGRRRLAVLSGSAEKSVEDPRPARTQRGGAGGVPPVSAAPAEPARRSPPRTPRRPVPATPPRSGGRPPGRRR